MRLEKIKTQGLAHLSYFLSADGEAAVIDDVALDAVVLDIDEQHIRAHEATETR